MCDILTLEGVIILTGESYDLLTSIIKMMLEWELDYRKMPDYSKTVINRLNGYLIHHTKIPPSKNIREFIIQLKNLSIHELGFEINDEYKNQRILDENGHVDSAIKYWYENSIQNDDVDQNLVREFLLECRKEYKQTGNKRIVEMYSEVRAFINASNYCVTASRIMNLVGKYSNISDNIVKIREWYESVNLLSKENYVCPVCGKLLDNDILKEFRCTDMCMYYRDKESISPKAFELDSEIKYKKLKRGIYTYTLLPGVSEQRIYEQLAERYGNDKVILYPEIDKFDISVIFDTGVIYVDVKDFASPYDLVETLIKNQSFIKMESVRDEDYIYLVIPEHRRNIYKGGNYKNVVNKRIRQLTNKVHVVYEDELYREVGDIINELF